MPLITIAAVVFAIQSAPAKEQEPTLKPLCEVAQRLDDGIKAFLAGKDTRESFGKWDVGETTPEVAAKLREDLVGQHVTAAKTVGVDLRLHFYADKQMVYEVQSFFHVTPAEATLLAFRGRPSSSSGKTSVLPEKCAKDAKAFADAGLALLKLLKTKKAADLPMTDADKVVKLLPAFLHGGMKKEIEASKARADDLRKDLNGLKYDEMKIALNELLFTAMGAEGLTKEGLVRGKLKFTDEGEVTFRLAGYDTK